MTAATTTMTRPEWCTDHITDDGRPVTHVAKIHAGSVEVEVEQYVEPREGEQATPFVELPDALTLDTAREVLDYIAALQQAAALVEGVGPDEHLCERCAPHAADAFEAGHRAGMRIARHGQQ